MICKWCGEEFTPGTWPDYCSEGCMENAMDHPCISIEERAELQERFDHWLERQERKM